LTGCFGRRKKGARGEKKKDRHRKGLQALVKRDNRGPDTCGAKAVIAAE